ncbi:MAG: glycosyltransferase [Ruminococcus sp.]|nr:glycosyltransferase [Ruminococcus sp.]
MPEISIIMPCYNTAESMLMKCVESILSQTFTDFELIIVDDGSREGYERIYHEIQLLDNRIRVERKQNGGVSAARNYGLQFVTGRYIVYVDSDDVLLPHFFEEAYTVAEKEQADIVYGCNMHMNDYTPAAYFGDLTENDVSVLSEGELSELRPNMVGTRLRFQNGLIYIGRGPWTRLVKSEIGLATPFPEGLAICEDIVWNLHILSKCRKGCIVKRVWYLYNMGNLSSSTKRYNPNIMSESRDGLTRVAELLDMQNNKEYQAFADKCFEEINRIYYGYIGHSNCRLEVIERKHIEKILYTESPWYVIRNRRFRRLSSIKDKVRIFLYRHKLYFIYLSIKRKLKS